MKSVVMIAYWFPPEGNAAVYRPLRFLRNLPASGWSARVIAADGPFERYDPDLSHQVPAGTEVVRVAGQDLWQLLQRHRAGRKQSPRPPAIAAESVGPAVAQSGMTVRAYARALVRKGESWWYHPDQQRPWIQPALAATLAMCERQRPDVLWATGPPFSAFVIAYRAARRSGIPYVLDFRTSWTVVPSPFEARRPAWAQRRDRTLLRRLLGDAQAVVFFYAAEAECFWRMYRGALDVSRIHVIPNGFDGEIQPASASRAEQFTILYTGTLSDYGFDGFLEALEMFVRQEPARVRQLSVQFVGEVDPALERRVRESDLSGIVSIQSPVSHAAVEALQERADVLLMLERKPTHQGFELLAGAKLFGYLKAGKPILGVVPDGEAQRILREVGVTTVANASSVADIVRVIKDLFSSWSAGTLGTLVPDREQCAHYSGRAQTLALARALEGRPALSSFVPGTHEVAPSLRSDFAAAGWA